MNDGFSKNLMKNSKRAETEEFLSKKTADLEKKIKVCFDENNVSR